MEKILKTILMEYHERLASLKIDERLKFAEWISEMNDLLIWSGYHFQLPYVYQLKSWGCVFNGKKN